MALCAHRRQGLGATGLDLGLHQRVDVGMDRRGIRVTQLIGMGIEPGQQHLGVTAQPELRGGPAELVAQVARPVRVDERGEHPQPAAQPPGCYAHLVHGVGQVAPDPHVLHEEAPHVREQVGVDRVTGGIVGADRGGLGDVRGGFRGRTQCAAGVRGGAGHRAVCQQQVDHRIQRAAVCPEGPDLQLAESPGDDVTVHDRHDVVHELGDLPVVRVEEDQGRPLGVQRGHGQQGVAACQGGHDVGHLRGHLTGLAGAQRQAHLVVDAGGGPLDGHGEVPALVRPTCTAAQRHAPPDEAQVLGVVVDGADLYCRPSVDPRDPGVDSAPGQSGDQPHEVGHAEEGMDAQLALHCPLGGRGLAHVRLPVVRVSAEGISMSPEGEQVMSPPACAGVGLPGPRSGAPGGRGTARRRRL